MDLRNNPIQEFAERSNQHIVTASPTEISSSLLHPPPYGSTYLSKVDLLVVHEGEGRGRSEEGGKNGKLHLDQVVRLVGEDKLIAK